MTDALTGHPRESDVRRLLALVPVLRAAGVHAADIVIGRRGFPGAVSLTIEDLSRLTDPPRDWSRVHVHVDAGRALGDEWGRELTTSPSGRRTRVLALPVSLAGEAVALYSSWQPVMVEVAP
jgi:hypothetical protein